VKPVDTTKDKYKAVCKDCGNDDAISINGIIVCSKCKCRMWILKKGKEK